ncbi:hypothetical protein O181_095412 [Austropuccinia psidii MF-1]|uniref:Uncharacterized protein n=1 Tax=Austropuccinia psidii MF-1 TaxID=1389203 RepID=A0A9Q3PCH0_9BASI|nr:hypothetical protein [Austropuccinia psidii MF-1]
MTTKRGSQYSIQSDGPGLRIRIDPSKGKRMGKSPSGTEPTQESGISQRKVPEMPILSEPYLKISMSNIKRYKSHAEGSNRHIYEKVQTVLHGVQGQGLQNFATNPPRSDKLLAYPEKALHREGNSEILQWMESTIILTSNQKEKAVPCKKEGSPSSFYQQAISQLTSPRREEEREKDF